ncbi:cardiotrophin-1 isoform X2 [Rhinatrema bivittatum]|uniref:cardiotrophin-1 isoform X2 n=1 Tax=Rhinatrema bivittatum TaxID=194408 RepID=UPI00112BE2A6|nr:cardiotrophin-1 isoform X2 [Rhinatrema bivittatum]
MHQTGSKPPCTAEPGMLLVSRSALLSSTQSQEAAEKIEQIHNQALMLAANSQELLQEYLKYQGEPFGQPGIIPAQMEVPGLPSPVISQEAWLSFSNAERLRQNYVAYAVLPGFLLQVRRWQEDLNPIASELLGLLEKSAKQTLGLQSNLASLLKTLGFLVPLVSPPPAPEASSAFLQKLLGWRICQDYQDWLHRTERDFTVLAQRYPL